MGIGFAHAQSSTRSFQMALWTDPAPNADTDIATFWAPDAVLPGAGTEPQPPAPLHSILLSHSSSRSLYDENYDWSRIIAVEFDEPYAGMDHLLKYPHGDTPACQPNSAELASDIEPIDRILKQRAEELHALAPKARFWVNFDRIEAHWMWYCNRPDVFNRDYIDVVSADWSDDGANNTMASAQQFYSVVAANPPNNKPDQQLALIPGVYSAPDNQLEHLKDFFDYANYTNEHQTCNLPLGSRGITGVSDGCPIWMVLGWLSGRATAGGKTYVGMLESGSEDIKEAWEDELELPLAPALDHQRTPGQILQPILQLFLD
jgi:hypothetical protein